MVDSCAVLRIARYMLRFTRIGPLLNILCRNYSGSVIKGQAEPTAITAREATSSLFSVIV